MGINPNNKITTIIRMLFTVTLFQHDPHPHAQKITNIGLTYLMVTLAYHLPYNG
jgi:hypothetical protein